MAGGGARREQCNSLAEVEAMLAGMKLANGWSMKELSDDVRRRGISLKNGVEYGSQGKLRRMMLQNPSMIVDKDKVKAHVHAKKCLIELAR